MDNISVWMNVNEVLLKGGFLIFLAAAGYQDLKDRRIHICLFLAFGTAGAALKGIHMPDMEWRRHGYRQGSTLRIRAWQ